MIETELELVLQMKNFKAGKLFSLKNNTTVAPSGRGEHGNGGVYTNEESDFEKNGRVASICVGVIIVVAMLVLCGLLCYRQVSRRRKQSWANQEKARKESIRQAVRLKLQEFETVPDSTPWLDQESEVKTSSVTFGDVILINPSDSSGNSPIPEHRKYYGNYVQHQVYRQIHHHIIYGGSKRRIHHSAYRRDQSQISYRQHHQAQHLQSQLNMDDDHTRDNKIRMYRNSDHPRFSVHKVEPRAEHARESLVNSTHILQMFNKNQHKLPSDNMVEQTTERGREVFINSRDTIKMPNADHNKLLDNKVESTTEHEREAPINSRHILMMPINDHHRPLHNKKETTTELTRETPANSIDITLIPNKDHHKLLDTNVEPITEYDVDVSVSSRDIIKMPNKDHHKLSLRKKLEPATEHGQKVSDNSRDIIKTLNKDHHELLLHRKTEQTTDLAREVPPNSTNIIKMPNKDHHKLSLHKKLEPATDDGREVRSNSTNSSQKCTAPTSNSYSTISTNLPQNSRICPSRIVVLHKDYSQRIVKRSSAVVPIRVDAVY